MKEKTRTSRVGDEALSGRSILIKHRLFFILYSGFILSTGFLRLFPPVPGDGRRQLGAGTIAGTGGTASRPEGSRQARTNTASRTTRPLPQPRNPARHCLEKPTASPGAKIETQPAGQPNREPERIGEANTPRTALSPDQLPGQTSPVGRAQPGLRRPSPAPPVGIYSAAPWPKHGDLELR